MLACASSIPGCTVSRAALEIARESKYGAIKIEREYQLEPKLRDNFGANTAPVAFTLFCRLMQMDPNQQDQLVNGLCVATHMLTSMPHTSLALCAPPHRSLPQLPMVQITQHVFDEVVFLSDIQVSNTDQRIVVRAPSLNLRGTDRPTCSGFAQPGSYSHLRMS